MAKKVAILGFYGHGNIGDEAILKGIESSLREVFRDINICVISDEPESVTREHNLRAVGRIQPLDMGLRAPKKYIERLFSMLSFLRKTNVLIVGGGGLFQDYYRRVPYGAIEIITAKFVNRPIIIYSVGVGPYRTKLGKLLARIVLNQADLITVRDHSSKKWTQEIGVKKSTIMTVDPALILQPDVHSDMNTHIPGLGKKERPWIGISVRPWFGQSEYKNILAQISNYVVSKYDAEIIFIPLHHKKDEEVSREIIGMMQIKNRARVLDQQYTIDETMAIIGKMDLLISMRLHATIFAAKMNVPIIGIIYDPKVESFLERIEQKSYASHINSLNVEDMKESIDLVWNQKEQIRIDMSKKVNYMENLVKKQVDFLKTFLSMNK